MLVFQEAPGLLLLEAQGVAHAPGVCPLHLQWIWTFLSSCCGCAAHDTHTHLSSVMFEPIFGIKFRSVGEGLVGRFCIC